MDSEEGIHGKVGIDDISAGTADVASVGGAGRVAGLTLRDEFGERQGIALSTLTWWRRVFSGMPAMRTATA